MWLIFGVYIQIVFGGEGGKLDGGWWSQIVHFQTNIFDLNFSNQNKQKGVENLVTFLGVLLLCPIHSSKVCAKHEVRSYFSSSFQTKIKNLKQNKK